MDLDQSIALFEQARAAKPRHTWTDPFPAMDARRWPNDPVGGRHLLIEIAPADGAFDPERMHGALRRLPFRSLGRQPVRSDRITWAGSERFGLKLSTDQPFAYVVLTEAFGEEAHLIGREREARADMDAVLVWLEAWLPAEHPLQRMRFALDETPDWEGPDLPFVDVDPPQREFLRRMLRGEEQRSVPLRFRDRCG